MLLHFDSTLFFVLHQQVSAVCFQIDAKMALNGTTTTPRSEQEDEEDVYVREYQRLLSMTSRGSIVSKSVSECSCGMPDV